MNIDVNVQASIKLSGKKVIYFDPYKIKDDLHDADYIFITHNHYDHLDHESIEKIKNDHTKIIVPEYLDDEFFGQAILVEPNREYEIDDLIIMTYPSYNINSEYHPKENGNVAYLVDFENTKYFVLGDTDITPEIMNVRCDICFIPIGGTYTCNFSEAAEYINKIRPREVIPIHYGSIVGDISLGNDFKNLIDKEIKVNIKIKEKEND